MNLRRNGVKHAPASIRPVLEHQHSSCHWSHLVHARVSSLNWQLQGVLLFQLLR
jgi:hypothetical protein